MLGKMFKKTRAIPRFATFVFLERAFQYAPGPPNSKLNSGTKRKDRYEAGYV